MTHSAIFVIPSGDSLGGKSQRDNEIRKGKKGELFSKFLGLCQLRWLNQDSNRALVLYQRPFILGGWDDYLPNALRLLDPLDARKLAR